MEVLDGSLRWIVRKFLRYHRDRDFPGLRMRTSHYNSRMDADFFKVIFNSFFLVGSWSNPNKISFVMKFRCPRWRESFGCRTSTGRLARGWCSEYRNGGEDQTEKGKETHDLPNAWGWYKAQNVVNTPYVPLINDVGPEVYSTRPARR